ncbi:MAG: L,D-transpeptidase [Nocardioidaceae bacterium]|nr:L,D-transpeptidase [Nocardioidaceae bacterium]
MTPLAVDGISGPLTRQQLCTARVLLGLPVSRSDMAMGGDEEAELLALTSVPIPPGAPTDHERWTLIDMTCQVLIAGTGTSGVTFVFPASTGSAGYETRVLAEAAAFRFDPALDNGGWHDSTEFPAAYDNPLNGNLYRPIYFSNGQAIHGANNVPPQPASKGCVRLRVDHQDQLVAWLGLDDADGPVWMKRRINLTVSTLGSYLPDP